MGFMAQGGGGRFRCLIQHSASPGAVPKLRHVYTCIYVQCIQYIRIYTYVYMLWFAIIPANEQKNVGGLLTVRTTSGWLQNALSLPIAGPNSNTTPNGELQMCTNHIRIHNLMHSCLRHCLHMFCINCHKLMPHSPKSNSAKFS